MAAEFFDILGYIFTNKNEFDKLSDLTLSRNSFMVNRTIAIQYPLQVNAFNTLSVNQIDVMKFWSHYLGGQNRIPYFVYTKGSKRASEDKNKKMKMPPPSLIKQYCCQYGISPKDISAAIDLFPTDTINDILDFDKTYNSDK